LTVSLFGREDRIIESFPRQLGETPEHAFLVCHPF
jgi:hypothetical protein